jgi:hypothetical protein
MSAWISTDASQPKRDTCVAVYVVQGDDEYPTCGFLPEDDDEWVLDFTFDNDEPCYVTHWYPLSDTEPDFGDCGDGDENAWEGNGGLYALTDLGDERGN